MKSWPVIVLLGLLAGAVPARGQADATDELMSSVEKWAQENLDDSVLQALQQVDRDRVRAFLADLEGQFEGTNVYRLGALRESAGQIAGVLQQFEETQPLGVWLRTRLDYLDMAEELRREAETSRTPPGTTLERSVWVKELAGRPAPVLAREYLPGLKQAFIEEGAPPQLVWVAEVESSFDPRARSPAGAAGLFQLMPATARDQGLASFPRDERYQPDKSAHAAARQLLALHRHFGDWRLALAAYNAGEKSVDGLLKKYDARSFEGIAGHLPSETQMYVPKVEATVQRREGIALSELKAPKG